MSQLYIFNRNEEITAVLEQGSKTAPSFYDAKIKRVINGEQILSFKAPYIDDRIKTIEEQGYVAVKNKYKQWELFIISELQFIHGERIEVEVTAEASWVELDNVLIEKEYFDRKKPAVVLPALLKNTRWSVGKVLGEEIHTKTFRETTVLGALQDLRDTWNGELSFYIEIAGNTISKRIVDFSAEKGSWKGKRFEWNKDLSEVTRTVDSKHIKTALMGYGNEISTEDSERTFWTFKDIEWKVANGNPVDKPLGQIWVGDEEARLIWGKPLLGGGVKQHLMAPFNTNSDNPEEVLEKTWEKLQELKTPLVTYTVKAIDLYHLTGIESEVVELGDTVAVLDRDLGLTLQSRIIEVNENLDYPEQGDFVLGNFLPTFTDETELITNRISTEIGNALANQGGNYLKPGDIIDPAWIDTEFDFARDMIRTGKGTVIMNEGDGILIVDDIVNPQKAIRLYAGMISLANSRNLQTGEFNWRNFGTGEGWLADLVETGKLRFNNAEGGILSLGGIGNVHGILQVLNSDGDIIVTLTAESGGFDKLSIGELTSIQTTNILTSTHGNFLKELQSNGEIVFYVDSLNGDDNNIGTKDSPKSTITNCISLLPKYLDRIIRIFVLPTLLVETEILIEGFYGTGEIIIDDWPLNVRYIRDWVNGSNVNRGSHWIEIQLVDMSNTVRHAGGVKSRMSCSLPTNYWDGAPTGYQDIGRISNGVTTYNLYFGFDKEAETEILYPNYVQVDLGASYLMRKIIVWHYYQDKRIYNDTKTEVSEDGVNWITLFDSERQGTYAEQGTGHEILNTWTLNGVIEVKNCHADVTIWNGWVNAEGIDKPAVLAQRTKYIKLSDMVIFGNPTQIYAIFVTGSNARIAYSEVNNASSAGICGSYGSFLDVYHVVGSGFPYGITSYGTTVTSGGGKAPWGTTAHQSSQWGGILVGTWTPTVGDYSTQKIVQKTTQWTANDTQSLFGTTNWSLSDYIYQGKRNSTEASWYGVAFFNTRSFSALTETPNRAIRKVRILVKRYNGYGTNSSLKPVIYWSAHASVSGIPAISGKFTSPVGFSWGEQKWIDLPISFGEAFRDGKAKSIVFYDGNNTANYMRFEPSMTLEITHG